MCVSSCQLCQYFFIFPHEFFFNHHFYQLVGLLAGLNGPLGFGMSLLFPIELGPLGRRVLSPPYDNWDDLFVKIQFVSGK